MKVLGQRYAQYFNRTYQRTGALWDGRYRSCPVQEEQYLMNCQRYIELNPVRAGMVKHPADYRWSSYRVNAHGLQSSLVTPHEVYLSLGSEPVSRRKAYRQLFQYALDPKALDEIRAATKGNFVLGSDSFAKQISAALGRRVVPSPIGRPPKTGVRPQFPVPLSWYAVVRHVSCWSVLFYSDERCHGALHDDAFNGHTPSSRSDTTVCVDVSILL